MRICLLSLLLIGAALNAGELDAGALPALPGIPALHHEKESEERFQADQAKTKNKLVRGATMVAKFVGKVTALDKFARIEARRHVATDGSINYELLSKDGDKSVQKELIVRYINLEMDQKQRGSDDYSVTPKNYHFKFKGTREEDGREVDVFEVHPRKRRVGFFKGEVWVDTETGLNVHEAGQLVKSPSVFLKSVRFVRNYEIREGIQLPKTTAVYTDTRLLGMAELEIEYSDVTWDTASAVSQSQN